MSQVIQFRYKIKRPKLLENDVFILYSPQKLTFQPGENKIVDMKLNIKFSTNIRGSCKLLFRLSDAGLQLQNCNYLSDNTHLHFEILNLNITQSIEIKSKDEIDISFQTTLGEKYNTNMLK